MRAAYRPGSEKDNIIARGCRSSAMSSNPGSSGMVQVINPAPASDRVTFGDSASNQTRRTYPPPNSPSPPAAATADAKAPPEAGVIGASTIGCLIPKRLVSLVVIVMIVPQCSMMFALQQHATLIPVDSGAPEEGASNNNFC